MTQITACDAARTAVELAEEASSAGTFGVGAVLVARDGTVLHSERNHVVVDGQIHDPIGHAERRLLDWYFENRIRNPNLPAPSDCYVVSSLDPCLHCASALLAGKFKSISLASDSHAGVFSKPGFACLPTNLRIKAKQTFFRFVDETQADHAAINDGHRNFWVTSIPKDLRARAQKAFEVSLQRSQLIAGGGVGSSKGSAKFSLADVKASNSQGLTAGFDEAGRNQLALFMTKNAKDNLNSAAFFDPQNSLMIAASDRTDLSPIRLALGELVRSYTKLRLKFGISHPRECMLLTYFGPGADALGLLEIGAYGSTLELPINKQDHWVYVEPRQSEQELRQTIAALPPLYSDTIGIHPTRLPGANTI